MTIEQAIEYLEKWTDMKYTTINKIEDESENDSEIVLLEAVRKILDAYKNGVYL